MHDFTEYRGMSYEQASKESERLVNKDGWFRSFQKLAVLREIMVFHMSVTRDEEAA